VQSATQAQLLLNLEGGIEKVLLGLQASAHSPLLQRASAQLRLGHAVHTLPLKA